jgi:hypothetical protein
MQICVAWYSPRVRLAGATRVIGSVRGRALGRGVIPHRGALCDKRASGPITLGRSNRQETKCTRATSFPCIASHLARSLNLAVHDDILKEIN